jgi:hypothetical protein
MDFISCAGFVKKVGWLVDTTQKAASQSVVLASSHIQNNHFPEFTWDSGKTCVSPITSY